jgi:hypothetical protein
MTTARIALGWAWSGFDVGDFLSIVVLDEAYRYQFRPTQPNVYAKVGGEDNTAEFSSLRAEADDSLKDTPASLKASTPYVIVSSSKWFHQYAGSSLRKFDD